MALDSAVRQAFEQALAPADVISDPVQCRAYECDGLTGYRVVPDLVLLPRDAEQVAAAVRVCHEHGVPFVARGAGTGLSGGALPVADGVVIDAGPTAGYGAWVKLRHADGTVTLYGHVNTWTVTIGERVMAGDQIATIGNRGNSTGPHCHFSVLANGTDFIDPVPWLAKRGLTPGNYVG